MNKQLQEISEMIGDKNLFGSVTGDIFSQPSGLDHNMIRPLERNKPWKATKLNNRSNNLSNQNSKLMTKSSNNFNNQSKLDDQASQHLQLQKQRVTEIYEQVRRKGSVPTGDAEAINEITFKPHRESEKEDLIEAKKSQVSFDGQTQVDVKEPDSMAQFSALANASPPLQSPVGE